MHLAFFDGLDSLIEYYIPAAKDYPIALAIYLLVLALPRVRPSVNLQEIAKEKASMKGGRNLTRECSGRGVQHAS